MIQILTQPKMRRQTISSIIWLRRCRELEFTEALKRWRKALERKTGARGLRSIIEAVLWNTMYGFTLIPKTYEKVIVDENDR